MLAGSAHRTPHMLSRKGVWGPLHFTLHFTSRIIEYKILLLSGSEQPEKKKSLISIPRRMKPTLTDASFPKSM